MSGTLASLLVHLGLEVDDWGRNTRKAGKDIDDLADRIDKFGSSAGRKFLDLANNLSNIPTAIQGAAGVTSILGQMSGAIGVLPGIAAAGAAGMVALKVGVQGFGDAVKNAGDPEKFAESLKTLSPAARETAIAVRDLRDDWEKMQNSVQEDLFASFGRHIQTLGDRYLPVLDKGLSGVAAELNFGAQKTAQFLTQARQVNTVSGIFGEAKEAVGQFSMALPHIVSMLLDITAVSSEFLPGLTGGFADAAKSAAAFIREARETGRLEEWISTGLSTLGDLWTLFKNIGSIVATVFGAFDASGAGFLNTLIAITDKVKTFLQSVQGQQALKALASALNTVSTVATDVLLTALEQLAPVIVELAPGFAELARQVGGMLVAALQIAGPLLMMLAGFISDNIDVLGPLAIALYLAVQAFQAVTMIMRIVNLLAMTNPWLLLIAATIALAVLIATNWDKIKGYVKAAVDFLVDMFLNWTLPGLIIKHWDTIVEAVRTAVRMVLDAVGWLGELPGRVAAWFGQVKDSAVRKLGELLDFVRSLPGRILDALGNLGELLINAGQDIVLGLLRGIGNFAHKIYDKIKSIASSAWDAVTDFFDIFSPSKKMQWAGEMLGAGFAKGIDSMSNPVADAAERLAAAAMFDPVAVSFATPDVPAPRVPSLGTRGGDGASADGGAGGYRFHIEHFHPPANASPQDVSEDLLWHAKARG